MGGLARNAAAVQSVRKSGESVLLLDCGGMFLTRIFAPDGLAIAAETGFKAMDKMGYDAMSPGWKEFSLGTEFLKKAMEDLSFSLITSNLVHRDSGIPFGREYVIKKTGNVRVGIAGVMALNALENVTDRESVKGLKVLDPEDVLKRMISELRKKADFIVLLSQCGFEATTALVNAVDGIDLAVAGGRDKAGAPVAPAPCGSESVPVAPGGAVDGAAVSVVKAPFLGTKLGYFQATLDDAGKVARSAKKVIYLGSGVSLDPEIAAITGDEMHKKVREERKIRAEKREKEIIQEVKELWKLSPEEYMRMQLKEQAESMKGKKK